MKSIKQQYIDLTEGKMSQSNFMRNLRMTMPQYVTNVTSFKDAVRILKNKRILNENNVSELGPAAQQMAGNPEEEAGYRSSLVRKKFTDTNITPESLKQELADMLERGEITAKSYVKSIKKLKSFDIEGNKGMTGTSTVRDVAIELVIAAGGEFIEPYEPDEDDLYWADDDGEDDDTISTYREAKSLNEAKKTKLTADQVNNDELRMGIRVEMEHTDDPKKAKKIALDHLAENPFYYTQLKLSGVDTKALPSKEKKAIAKKKDETELVDKANQMKTPKGVEKIKASANKAKKETNKPEKGIKMMSLVSKTVRGVQKMDATGEKMKKIKENLESMYDAAEELAKQMGDYDSAVVALQDEMGLDSRTADQIASQVYPGTSVPQRVFAKNANITRGINAIARGEDPMARLREAIRKMIKQGY